MCVPLVMNWVIQARPLWSKFTNFVQKLTRYIFFILKKWTLMSYIKSNIFFVFCHFFQNETIENNFWTKFCKFPPWCRAAHPCPLNSLCILNIPPQIPIYLSKKGPLLVDRGTTVWHSYIFFSLKYCSTPSHFFLLPLSIRGSN